MNRSRSWLTLLAVTLASATIFAGGYWMASRICAAHLSRSTDDLEWLRMEFQLSGAEMQRIRQLHEGYLPQCEKWCRLIAARKRELEVEMTKSSSAAPTAKNLLDQISALRANCQAGMLQHFEEVSQVMPPEQGRRYLAEMRRLTLGSHEQIEESMAGPDAPHGHH